MISMFIDTIDILLEKIRSHFSEPIITSNL